MSGDSSYRGEILVADGVAIGEDHVVGDAAQILRLQAAQGA